MMRADALTGAAGVYCVAAQLNAMGYHAALTIRSVPHVDLLTSTLDGSRSVALQVKTARSARRWKGKQNERVVDHYEFAMSEKSWEAALESKNLLFAFVDLRCEHGNPLAELPDVFIVPTSYLKSYYQKVVKDSYGGDPANWKWKRLHAPASGFDKYKNNWDLLVTSLRARH
jgi:hypothetical protein